MTVRMIRAATWSSAIAAAALVAVPLLAPAQDKKPGNSPEVKPEMYRHGASPMTPEETLATFKVAPGLKATVWASEPGLVKPTDMDIDSRGRIWVTEAANYRRSRVRPEGDRIMILEDTKHTGVCDSYKVFVQDPKIVAPLGICVLGNKVFVSQAPHMLVYTIDASGDKPVGEPQEIFTGFSGIDHDHGLHAGLFGPDGRFYFNCGNEGNHGAYVKFGSYLSQHDGRPVVDVTGTEIGGKSTKVRGHDRKKGEGYRDGLAMSMNLDGSDFEVLGYNFRNNYELTVDSFGSVFQSDNDDDGNQGVRINYVMEGGNFGYTGPTGSSWSRDMAEYAKIFPGQTKQEAQWHQQWPGVVPNLLNTGQGSPCGITVYEGDLLPDLYQGAIIHADCGPCVVRACITRPGAGRPTTIMKPVTVEEAEAFKKESSPAAGAGYESVVVNLIEKGADHWFRPDDVCVAPDGALYVTDWYDPGVGGHATGDTGTIKHGNDWHLLHGRVYRITPENYTPPAATPKPDLETVAGQVAALNSPNFATRYLGYSKLLEGIGSKPVVDALKTQFETCKKARLRARALWLLARSEHGKRFIEQGLKDKDADIRVAALRAARRVKLDVTQFADEVLADPAPALRRELALALQFQQDEKVLPLIVKLADKYDGKDRWYLEAIGIACNEREKAVLQSWEKLHQNKDPKNNEDLLWRLKMEPVQGGPPATQPAAGSAHASAGGAVPFAFDNGVAAHDARNGIDLMPAVVASQAAYEGVSSRVRIADRYIAPERNGPHYGPYLAEINGKRGAANVGRALPAEPSRGGQCPPYAARPPLASSVGGRRFTCAEQSSFDSCADSAPMPVAATAPAATQPAPAPKQFKTRDGKILPSMEDLAKLSGDVKNGAAVFRNVQAANCIKCHQIGDEGLLIGPPLTAIGGKLSKAQMYEAILYPSAAIEMGYEAWVVKTKDGEVYSGILAEDTPDRISIKDTDAKYHDVDRDKIDRLVKQSISLMPEGLNEAMTQKELVDLVEYMASLKP